MIDLLSKLLTDAFVILIYMFIFAIIRLVYKDIRTMSRKKSGLPSSEAFLKPMNVHHDLAFDTLENYALMDDNIIGRNKNNSIFIDDPFMSGEHARVYKQDHSYFIEDLSSTNGTTLNGELLDGDAIELFDGDRIGIGQLDFVFLMPTEKDGEIVL